MTPAPAHVAVLAGTAAIVIAWSVRPTRPPARTPRPSNPRLRRRLPSPGHVSATVLAAAGTIAVGWLPTMIVATAVVLERRVRPLLAARRRRHDAQRQLPDAIERLVLLVHAGLSPQLAVRAAAEAAPPAVAGGFDGVVLRLDRGVPLSDALESLPAELGPRASPIADAFAAAERYGLPLEPMLDQLARDARSERRRLDEADARRLPVRLAFPLVTCTLPSFVLVAIAPAVLAALSSLGGSAG